MHKAMAAMMIAGAAGVAGCGHARSEDGGPNVSRTYPVGSFEQIEVAGPYDVQVRTGGKPGVEASGPQRMLERTRVEVKDGRLVIEPEKQRGWFGGGWHTRGKARFIVTVPALSGATIAGSGGIAVDRVAGASFEGTVAGSGDLQLAATDVQTLKLTIGGSGGIKAGPGKAKLAEYDIAGSGGIDAAGLAAEQAKVSIAGSGSVRANATGTADVSIMGSGDVNIAGGAKCAVSKMGSGDVHCS